VRPAGLPETLEVVDSHTEGEPTRVVVGGWPPLEAPTMAGRREELDRRFGPLWRGAILEPRGHDALVGALLTAPVSLDTPVGTVGAELAVDGLVTIENVPARCLARDVAVEVPGVGRAVGDVAYGGNWFFLVRSGVAEAIEPGNGERLRTVSLAIQKALAEGGVTGDGGEVVDHVILYGPPSRSDADSRNYVMCPGGAYDRSPCGTGTSARMAALHARGELRPGQRLRQESITGSLFTGWLEERGGGLVPRIQGRAFVTGKTTLYFDPRDPFRHGLGGHAD
jgi:4-hydroxyproline epimerase